MMLAEEYKRLVPPGTPVLVTGATGFTGSVLLRKLVEMGLKAVAIARPGSNIEQFRGLPVEWVRGDVFDEATIKKAVAGAEYIFHVAAAYREAKITDEDYYNVHVLSTQLLAKAALDAGSLKRFVHISTGGVHSHIENPPADENYPIQPGDIYQRTKAEAELWIRDFSEKHGLPFSVVRPAAIYGPGDRRLFKIFQLVSKKWIPSIGSGNHLYHLIHVDDLTDFFILAAVHPKALGEVFLCGSNDAIPYKEIIRNIAESYNISVRFIKIPTKPLFILGDICEFICRPLGIEPPIYRRRIAFFTKDRSFNTQKMRNVLGFIPKHSDKEGLKETAKWYVDNGWISL